MLPPIDLPLKLIQECLRLASIATCAAMRLRLIAISRPMPLEAPVIKTVRSRKWPQYFRPVYLLSHDPPFWRRGLALPPPWDGEKNRPKSR